ncbi:MAG: type II secretion system protein [Patescibacteria group bacterium]|nr:type II secretion system protein [Patescibacteria group bacterium]
MIKRLFKNKGFTLIELLVVISIIGFLAVVSVAIFNVVRMNARDAVRAADISTIKRALAMYLNDSATGYPASTGECLNAVGGVGAALEQAQVLVTVPRDPLWPATAPGSVSGGFAVSPSKNFCYYYFSNVRDQFKISYYLESSSKSGDAGIHTTTQ